MTQKLQSTPKNTPTVFDRLRHRHVALTPEESVRQAFVDYMIDTLGYPVGLMANEITIKLNGTSRRCDTVLFARDSTPLMIVEYKAPSVSLSQSVLEQIVRYNLVLNARYLVLTNGRKLYCCRRDGNGCYSTLHAMPTYDEMTAT